jgi:hypothetical protein
MNNATAKTRTGGTAVTAVISVALVTQTGEQQYLYHNLLSQYRNKLLNRDRIRIMVRAK